MISFSSLLADGLGHPIQFEDTPIQKITIRPTKHFHRQSHAKASSQPIQAIVIDRFGKSHKKAMMQETFVASPSKLITIVKETPRRRAQGFEHKRKAKGPMNLNATNPIFYAEARVNGSFRDQPIRNVSGERI